MKAVDCVPPNLRPNRRGELKACRPVSSGPQCFPPGLRRLRKDAGCVLRHLRGFSLICLRVRYKPTIAAIAVASEAAPTISSRVVTYTHPAPEMDESDT